ncbi:GNAT family N-acetyltransferase [Candidatus Berkiella aquae]|uniref:GNAT family N-acetyltransferase n=1 Tax=Candidatus Berkiella aquae TaxID=295108 RepID=A0A0Q9YPK0_9GAMM|nr:GNAT family N-acetyltransferase [Candidatus Berkiella aquae]MCS5711896.1 GNAT family N-acetyltransferase [Candidatus Berkiella aquae]
MKKTLNSLESNQLLYRAFEMSDASRIFELLQEKEIVDNTLSIPYPYQKGMAEEWISTHQTQLALNDYKYAVILKEANLLIGAIEIVVTEDFNHGCLGYWLGIPYWGKGYGTEMVARIIQFGFEDLKLHRIYSEHFDSNIRSARVMEKNGMIQEGILREHKIKDGKFVNSNIKGILTTEWQKSF